MYASEPPGTADRGCTTTCPQTRADQGESGVTTVTDRASSLADGNCARSEVSQPLSQSPVNCHTVQPCTNTIFLDTETIGLTGIPFLLQFQIAGESKVTIVHVLEHQPEEIVKLIEALALPSMTWVGHNLMFDLPMISKLATIASMVSDWTFESIWQAERLWRGEVSYEERLKHLRLVYPGAVEDTMIAAMSLPPLEEQFLKSPNISLTKFPVAALPELKAVLKQALTRQPFLSGDAAGLDLGSRLRTTITGVSRKADKDRVKNAIAREDFTVLEEVRFSFKTEGLYTLKNIARMLGYPGETSEFNFLDDFGRIEKDPCPTMRDRDTAERLYKYVVQCQQNKKFMDYARRDVEMVRHVHQYYSRQPGYENLRHDFEVVPVMANLQLYGVHLDSTKVADTQRYYGERIAQGRLELQAAGLENFNSSDQVVHFVNKLLTTHVGRGGAAILGPVRDMQDKTLEQVVAFLGGRLGPDHQATQLMTQLVRVRSCHKRRSFFENAVGDSLFPQFSIKGTQTDRMTSHNPSIQNMPARSTTEEDKDGVHFRSAFTAPAGYQLLVGDFDQFEMRLVAAVAPEPVLVEAFQTDPDTDTHSLTAVRTLGELIRGGDPSLARLDDPALLQLLKKKDTRVKRFRSIGKTLNFAILYGASEHGVARQAGISLEESKNLIAKFHQTYPALSNDVRATHASLTNLQVDRDFRGIPRHRIIGRCETRVSNQAGVTRSFELPLRLVEILAKLGLAKEIGEYLPVLSRPMISRVNYFGDPKTPAQVVQSELRSAARKLQAYVHRQAYNFRIQSLGAFHTKRLQVALARPFILPGIHRAADLPVLPGINVHDEIHLYIKIPAAELHGIASAYVKEVSQELGVPIKFEFAEVGSWAEKA